MELLNHKEINRNWEDMKEKRKDEDKEARDARIIGRIKEDIKYWEDIERGSRKESMIALARETIKKLNNRLEKRV